MYTQPRGADIENIAFVKVTCDWHLVLKCYDFNFHYELMMNRYTGRLLKMCVNRHALRVEINTAAIFSCREIQ